MKELEFYKGKKPVFVKPGDEEKENRIGRVIGSKNILLDNNTFC